MNKGGELISPESQDQVVLYLQGKVEESKLSDVQIDFWNKIDVMDNLIRRYHQRSKAVSIFQKKFPDISQATAYNYYKRATNIMGSLHTVDKNYERYYMREMLQKMIKAAVESNNTKDMPRLMQEYGKVVGINEPDQINLDMLQRHVFIIDSDVTQLKLNPYSNSEKKALIESLDLPSRITKDVLADVIDADYQELLDED